MLNIEEPSRRRMVSLAWLASLIFSAALMLRNGGVVPFVFADEQFYSMYTRLVPMASAMLPDYVYFFVFKASLVCGEGFLDCVRGMNVAFFIGSAPFIYLSARRVATPFASVWVTFLALAGPLNSYTVYFMPEAMYFFAFWVASWFALGFRNSSSAWRWALLGCGVGLMAMIKPHALFLLPPLCVFAAYVHFRWNRLQAVRAGVAVAILTVATIGTKFAIGYLLVGKVGVTLFGNFYSGVANNTANGLQHYVAMGAYAGVSLGGHVLSIVLALGLAVAATAGLAAQGLFQPDERTDRNRTAVYSVLVLGCLLCVVALFTGSLAITDPNEVIRLHQRYYDFALPLLMIVGAGLTSQNASVRSPVWRGVLAASLVAALAWIFAHRFNGFRPGVLDGPWFDGLVANRRLFRLVACLMVLSAAAWPFAPRVASRAFLYLALPLSVLGSGLMVNRELAQHRDRTVYEKAGQFARQYVPRAELDQIVVVCGDPAEGFRVLFNIDSAGAVFQVQPGSESYAWKSLPAGKTWVLSITGGAVPDDALVKVQMSGFTLAKAPVVP
ncbi:phosphoglycerol transferase [Luteibacter sp. HA06]|jgi:phosphoglycerol transferase